MKFLRLIIIFFVIYLIRRFIQAYQTLKITQQLQAEELRKHQAAAAAREAGADPKVVDAEFKVVDR